MKNMHVPGPSARKASIGFTLVELIVAMTVTTILSVTIVSLVVVWLQQYSVSSVRNNLSTSGETAVRRIGDDIRKSTALLTSNSVSDANAPAPAGLWTSTSNRLVLAQSPRKSNGDLAYGPGVYTGVPDSIIYYLNNSTLYRRVLPANYTGNVNLPVVSCTGTTATGGCPADVAITSNVKSLEYVFYTGSGAVTTNPDLATSIKVTLQLEKLQAGNTVTITNTSTTALRLTGSRSSTTGTPFAAGPGGVILRNGGEIRAGGTNRDMYVKGKITFDISQAIGALAQPFRNVYVGNQACGTNYSSICGTEPITMGFGSIYADNICAAGQTTSSTAFGVLQTLNTSCTAPALDLPLFNKATHVAKMTNTVNGAVTCTTSPGCNVSLPANTRYNGSIGGGSQRLNLTLNGDLYVTGNFGNKATSGSQLTTTITVAEGVTTRPVIVVNGQIGLNWTTINANSSGVSPIFISFYSTDSASSLSDSYNNATAALVYSSLQQSAHAIDLDGPGTINGSFYAYYDSINLQDQVELNGTIAGQRVELSNGLVRINLTSDLWPS